MCAFRPSPPPGAPPDTGESPTVELRHASKRYSRAARWVLDDVSVAVAPRSLVEVRGANGSGKSTLLRLLAGATVPTRGTRLRAARAVGYAPDRLAPPPPFSAAGYLREHARLRRLDEVDAERQIRVLSDRLALRRLLPERLGALSKGSLQKVVLVQALLGVPSLVVLDEPFSGLDVDARRALGELLRERVASGAAVIFSDHRAAGSQIAADAIWLVADGVVHTQASSGMPLDAAALPGVLEAERDGTLLRVTVESDSSDAALSALLERGWHVLAVARSEQGTRIEASSK
jgi:ABC-type multidrug transport system ATPase subunit